MNQKPRVLASLLFLVLAFAALFSRAPDRITNAQFYAEDGTRFFYEAAADGWASVFSAINAHLNVGARIVACLFRPLPWEYMPLAYNLASLAIVAAIATRVFAAKIPRPAAILGAVAVIVVPNSGEPIANLCCLHFFTGIIFAVNLLEPCPSGRGESIRRGIEMSLAALSGPEVIVAAPLALWRMYQWRKEKEAAPFFLLFWVGAFVQIASLVTFQRGQIQPLGIGHLVLFSIYAKQLFLGWNWWTDFYSGYAQTLVVVLALAIIAFRNKFRSQFLYLLMGAALYVLAARSASGSFPNAFGNGARYAFIPFALVLWSFGWLWAGVDVRAKKGVAAVLIALVIASGVFRWRRSVAYDHHWATQIQEVRVGARNHLDFTGPGVTWAVAVPAVQQ